MNNDDRQCDDATLAAAMVGRAARMRLANRATVHASVEYCWNATPGFLKREWLELADYMLKSSRAGVERISPLDAPDIRYEEKGEHDD